MNAKNTWATFYKCNQNSNSYSYLYSYLYLGNISSTMSRKKLIALKHTIAIYYRVRSTALALARTHPVDEYKHIRTHRHTVKINTSHTGALENHLNQRDSINYYYNKYIYVHFSVYVCDILCFWLCFSRVCVCVAVYTFLFTSFDVC